MIPPLFVNNSFETEFLKKANIFNNHFANQCTVLNNDSILPELTFASDCRINDFLIQHDNVIKIIRDLNPAKAHGYDGISIRMIKMCAESIVVPLTIIFNKALTTSVYPDIWKRGNVVPVHKEDSKNLVKNYQPISLLHIFGKIFEKLFTMCYSSISKQMIFLLIVNLVFSLVIHAFRSSSLLHMISIKHLMETLL